MTTHDFGRWLLVARSIVGLAILTPVASAHGDDNTTRGSPPYDGTAADWAAWMDANTTEHVDPGTSEWMEAHVGETVDEMAQDVADGDFENHSRADQGSGMYGQGGGC